MEALEPAKPVQSVASTHVGTLKAMLVSRFLCLNAKTLQFVLVPALRGSAKSSRPDQLARALAVMHDPDMVGLGGMPSIEPSMAALIVSADKALRKKCTLPQCQVQMD